MKILASLSLILSLYAGDSYSLRSLKDVSSHSIQLTSEKSQVFMVFQEGCSACLSQVTDFKCLDVPVSLLGAFSSEKGLRKEYKKMKPKYPAYLASGEILKSLGVMNDVTPQTVLVTPKKKLIFKGLTDCENIKKYMKVQNG